MGPGAVGDRVHAWTHLTREPGDLTLVCQGVVHRPHREVSGHTPVMNEREKSDSLVVSGKPPNKAEQLAAVGVEGSRLAKRKTLECNAFRTQAGETRTARSSGYAKLQEQKGDSDSLPYCTTCTTWIGCVQRNSFSL
jgi:hypothetical protein